LANPAGEKRQLPDIKPQNHVRSGPQPTKSRTWRILLEVKAARIGTLAERRQYVLYWRAKFEETDALVKAHGRK
jgi:hypothetical protein